MSFFEKIGLSLKKIFIDNDGVVNDNESTESQITLIDESNVSEDIKSELKKSLINIDKKYVFNISETTLEQSINENNTKNIKNRNKVKVDSMKAVSELGKKVHEISEEEEKEIN